MDAAMQKLSNGSQDIPSDVLDDLGSRFIINVPDEERSDLIRICFQIELAHWFYLDFFCAISNDVVPCGIKQFAEQIFNHIPFLKIHLPQLDEILDTWKTYKCTVPTYGAILLTNDLKNVLLVQSYWAKSSWGFPKGKVNENEDPLHCAVREVLEETGYDISESVIEDQYIESIINYQFVRLYIVRNVPYHTIFQPRTRKEIKSCSWFPIDFLPTGKHDIVTKSNLGLNANSFFMIIPFVKRIKKWIYDQNKKLNKISNQEMSVAGQQNKLQQSQQQQQQQQQQSQYQPQILNRPSPQQQQQQQQQHQQYQLHQQQKTIFQPLRPQQSHVINNGRIISGKKGFNYNHSSTTSVIFNQNINVGNVTISQNQDNDSNNTVQQKRRQRHKSLGDIDSKIINNIQNTPGSSVHNKYSNKNQKSLRVINKINEGSNGVGGGVVGNGIRGGSPTGNQKPNFKRQLFINDYKKLRSSSTTTILTDNDNQMQLQSPLSNNYQTNDYNYYFSDNKNRNNLSKLINCKRLGIVVNTNNSQQKIIDNKIKDIKDENNIKNDNELQNNNNNNNNNNDDNHNQYSIINLKKNISIDLFNEKWDNFHFNTEQILK